MKKILCVFQDVEENFSTEVAIFEIENTDTAENRSALLKKMFDYEKELDNRIGNCGVAHRFSFTKIVPLDDIKVVK